MAAKKRWVGRFPGRLPTTFATAPPNSFYAPSLQPQARHKAIWLHKAWGVVLVAGWRALLDLWKGQWEGDGGMRRSLMECFASAAQPPAVAPASRGGGRETSVQGPGTLAKA